MENTANRIELRGELVSLPELSHENHGRKFFRFSLEVARLSGVCDYLPVVAPEDVLNQMDLFQGSRITVTGQIRSYNTHSDAKRKLLIFVYADTLSTSCAEPINDVFLSGRICKPPVYRRTPLGREICDVMLAVNRPYRKADYLPCILWGKNAQAAAQVGVGTQLELTGRLQSRQYTKVLDTGSELRTAYEISALTTEILDEFDLNESE